jgi:hypothetical protein
MASGLGKMFSEKISAGTAECGCYAGIAGTPMSFVKSSSLRRTSSSVFARSSARLRRIGGNWRRRRERRCGPFSRHKGNLTICHAILWHERGGSFYARPLGRSLSQIPQRI